MASITTNGVVLQVPYAIISNVRLQRTWTLAIVGLTANGTQLRVFSLNNVNPTQFSPFVYVGDIITFSVLAPCNDATAAAYDLLAVNFTTGATSTFTTVGFNQKWQTKIVTTITGINATSGAVSFTTAIA
jgi:hypothetical protein